MTEKFDEDFALRLTKEEWTALMSKMIKAGRHKGQKIIELGRPKRRLAIAPCELIAKQVLNNAVEPRHEPARSLVCQQGRHNALTCVASARRRVDEAWSPLIRCSATMQAAPNSNPWRKCLGRKADA